MRKKLFSVALALLVAGAAFAEKAPKYVFLFIGDGMGINHVNAAQMYKASMAGEWGLQPLCFTQFPVAGFATTYCANDLVTDSAASGTAIATGNKTLKGRVGLSPGSARLTSVAELAKSSGKKVAIISDLGVGEATPAAFYAHQKHRYMYDAIFGDMLECNFDFLAGSMISIEDEKPEHVDSVWRLRAQQMSDAGITYVHNTSEFEASFKGASKMVLAPNVSEPEQFVMDRCPTRLGLSEMLSDALDFLMKDGCKEGFFMMAEQDLIDGQSHGNDGASMINELFDLDEAVKIAYEFYLKHPKETAIIVTADHETGALALLGHDPDSYRILSNQKCTQNLLTKKLRSLMLSQEEVVRWEQVKDLLRENLGFWDTVSLSSDEEEALFRVYKKTVAQRESGHVVDPFAYADNAEIVHKAISILNKKAGLVWSYSSHSSGEVPVYAIGPRTGIFSSQNDNAQIGPKIAQIAGYGTLPQQIPADPPFGNGKVAIVAQCGYWKEPSVKGAQESIAALKAAQHAGFWGSEMDNHITADDIVVVRHDRKAGGKEISEYKYSELGDFRLENGEAIPTMDEYFKTLVRKDTRLILEIKSEKDPVRNERLVEKTLESASKFNALGIERLIVISWDMETCLLVKKFHPEVTVQLLGSKLSPKEVFDKGLDGIDYNISVFKEHPEWVEQAHKLGMSVHIWGVETPEDVEFIVGLGADMVTTMNPMDVRAALGDREQRP